MSDLFTNAFYLLGATTRTGKEQLIELAEDAVLSRDQSDVSDARSILSNPRSRLGQKFLGYLVSVPVALKCC